MVRGFTLSPSREDRYHCFGTIRGYDCIVFERSVTIHSSYGAPKHYKWLIVKLDLHTNRYGHFFINAAHYNQSLYSQYLVNNRSLSSIDKDYLYALSLNRDFSNNFRVFADPQGIDVLSHILTYEAIFEMVYDLPRLDYEVIKDSLLVYRMTHRVTSAMLAEIAETAVRIAEIVDFNSTVKHT